MKGVLRLKKDVDALKHLEEEKIPPRLQLIAMRQAVAYLMLYSSGLRFGSVMWSQIRLIS